MMKSTQETIVKDLVLIGGGHSHVIVLRKFGMNPIPGVRLTVIARDVHTPYSGMLPGYLAGHYDQDETHIDLRPLCKFANARLYHDEAIQIDLKSKNVICKRRPEVPYDVLSINIGSAPSFNEISGAIEFTTPVKPINNFVNRWNLMIERIIRNSRIHRIGIVGAGAGGVELLLAMQYRLSILLAEQNKNSEGIEFHLISKSNNLLPRFSRSVRQRFEKLLKNRKVQIHYSAEAANISSESIITADGNVIELDEILWATAAGAPKWLLESGLDVDRDGFIKVRDTLQSTSNPEVFAAGDIANVVNYPRPKAGVFAVRQGPPLAKNLRRFLVGKTTHPFRPQKSFLALISTGNRSAIASKWGISFEGYWVWNWKNWIDKRFIKKFNELPDMSTEETAIVDPRLADQNTLNDISAIAMRCGGCGAKVGASVLTQALANLNPIENQNVVVGLHDPDDAAIVKVPDGKMVVHTVDYFRAFIDDAYIFGQISANHALSDIFAMGAKAQTALAIATVPFGIESKVETSLREMMAGALKILNEAGATLIGGHTSEGPELALGFSVNGLADHNSIIRKGGMVAGDVLIVTKPLGTGTLFAADMQQKAKGRWIEGAIETMIQSNREAAMCLYDHEVNACTDITGFGLLGHLVEMTKASRVDVQIDLNSLPVLDGAQETISMGILSSLQPANLRLRRAIRNQGEAKENERFPLIFDPQTSGGLLASIPAEQAQSCLKVLQELGFTEARIVGHVSKESDYLEPIILN